jgi:alkanesulfonate monooxygenase SsuD/methylene tetrahydromethanopterin reductase-like flavin-dependent oxidoreductase (luciferase family)
VCARFGRRGRRIQEAVETCRQAWGGGLVEPAGVAVLPKPARPGGPPIWVGAESEPAIRRAAALADGWIAGEPDLTAFRTQLTWLDDELRERARPPERFDVAGYWPVFVWGEDGRAWEMVRPFHHYVQWKYLDAVAAKGRLGPLPQPPDLDESSEAALRAQIICGTPAEVAARIAEYAEAARTVSPHFTFIARMHYPGMDPGIVRAAARLFATDVIPAVRERLPAAD